MRIADGDGERRWLASREEEMAPIAEKVLETLEAGCCILLFGAMGAGKTTFVRHLAAALGLPAESVSSPTFSLAHEIEQGDVRLVHLDLYRLAEADFEALGLLDLLESEGWKAVEWAENLPARWWPESTVLVEIRALEGDCREVRLRPGPGKETD